MDAKIEIADEDLIRRVAEGDRTAYSVLVHRHALAYRGLAYRLLGDRALAEDIVQDAFLKLWTKADSFDARKAKFTTWFYRIVANRCLDEKRKKKPVALPEGFDAPDEAKGAEAAISERDKQRLLMTALHQLSDRQRLSVTLTYEDGVSNQEAAAIMGLNIKAFESLLLRSRAKLRDLLRGHKADLLSRMD